MIDKWMVVVSGPQLIDDVRRAPEEQLSFHGAVSEVIINKRSLVQT